MGGVLRERERESTRSVVGGPFGEVVEVRALGDVACEVTQRVRWRGGHGGGTATTRR